MSEGKIWNQIRYGLHQFHASTGMYQQEGQATYIEWVALNDLNERLKSLEFERQSQQEKP